MWAQAARAREAYDLALGGNEKAGRIFLAVGQALGVALATLVNTFNFPLYLLSGGVLAAWDLFAPPMLDEVRRRSFNVPHHGPAHRESYPGQRSRLVRRRLPAVGRG